MDKSKKTEAEMYNYLLENGGMMHDDETLEWAYKRELWCKELHGCNRTELAKQIQDIRNESKPDIEF